MNPFTNMWWKLHKLDIWAIFQKCALLKTNHWNPQEPRTWCMQGLGVLYNTKLHRPKEVIGVSGTVLKTSKANANFCTWYLQLWCNHLRFLFSLKITLWKFFIHLWSAFKDTKMLSDNFRFLFWLRWLEFRSTRIASIDAKVEVSW